MRVDPKALVRRLTPTATRQLELAVGRAASSESYEIVPEHLLSVLLEPDDGDAARLLAHYGKSRSALQSQVERAIAALRTGHAGRPILSQALFSCIRDAWLVASVERGASLVRSADLLATLAEHGERYLAETFSSLEELPHSELRKTLYDLVSDSAEANEAAPRATQQLRDEPTASTANGALARFTVSLTQQARDGKIDPVLGRHREIRQVIDILSRRRKNNPIIVGEPGVGKSALVEGLARAIVAGEVPDALRGVELVGLDLGALQAGSGVRGEFEQRLKSVIHEVKTSATPIILFIDEAHTLIGAGGAQGTGDAANLLKPELARGALRTIAATTFREYKKYFEKDAALERRFQPVKVEEPSEQEALTILRGLKETYERAHGISIRDAALVAATKLSHRYISGRQLPDKAVDLLDSAAARTKSEARAIPERLVALAAELATSERTHAALSRDKADGAPYDHEALATASAELPVLRERLAQLEQRWQQERAAVEHIARARSALSQAAESKREPLMRELEAAQRALSRMQGDDPLIHTEADAQAVARVVQSFTGIPVGKLEADSIHAVLDLERQLGQRIKGQATALRAVAEAVRMSHAGVSNPETPRAVLLFVGTSGVGKTETALGLADLLFGGERFLTSIAMSEFQEKHSLSRLIGSPPGYVGYGEGGVLTEAVRRHPYSVVLLDECEKADLEVMNLFYQVFDKGTLSDGEGRRVDFRNTIVILTSNLATDIIERLHEGTERPTESELLAAIRPTLSRHFKPALLARMTIVPFSPIAPEILREIVTLKLEQVRVRTRESHKADLTFAPELVDELTRRCTESESGARSVDHVLRGSLLPALSRELLTLLAEGKPIRTAHIGLRQGAFEVALG